MVRRVYQPTDAATGTVLPIVKGGTGEEVLTKATAAIGIVTKDMVTENTTTVKLDSLARVKKKDLPLTKQTLSTSVEGPVTLAVNAVQTYTITDFDIFTNYTVTPVAGTVTRNYETITYTAPNCAGVFGFIINGILYPVNVTGNGINKPNITSPLENATVASTVTVTASVFGVNTGTDTYKETEWEVSTNPYFYPSLLTKKSTGVTTQLTLTGNSKRFYIRCRHFGTTYKVSSWSNTIKVNVN